MSTLRGLRLLNAIENGTVSGEQLQIFLQNLGRLSEFSVILSGRGQTRRMAASPVTMLAITNSQAAIDIVFKAATAETTNAAKSVSESATAMSRVVGNKPSLTTAAANPIAWDIFNKSPYYEMNIKEIISRYADVNPILYSSIYNLLNDPMAMADIVAAPYSITAVTKSPASTSIVSASSVSMALVASNSVAIDIVAKETSIMSIIAGSVPAMAEITTRLTATQTIAKYPGAIKAVAANTGGWNTYLNGSHFATVLPLALANIIDVSPITFPTLDSIIADAGSLTKVAANKSAVQALASNSAAMSTLANSTNIGIILASSIAMGVIGPNVSAMTSFLNASGAWTGLFASSVAKGYIVSSTPLVNVVAANSTLIDYLKTIAVNNVSATGIPDGHATNMQAFISSPALPSKLITLSAKEVGIAATYSNYNFGGTLMTGSQAGATLSLSGTGVGGQPTHIAGYSGMTWNLQAIGVTAATLPIITYVNMS